MRLKEYSGYTLEEMLAEIDRRGFLKGLGAAAATAAVPSLAKASPDDKVKKTMDKLYKEDPNIVGYSLMGQGLLIRVLHTDGGKLPVKYSRDYEDRIAKEAGVRRVQFTIDTGKLKSSDNPYHKSPVKVIDPPPQEGPFKDTSFTLKGQVNAALNALDVGNERQACYHLHNAIYLASKEGNKEIYQKLSSLYKDTCR